MLPSTLSKRHCMTWFEITIIITGILGATLTYWLQHQFKFSAVQASAGPSLIIAIIAYTTPNLAPQEYILYCPLVFFGASFVGMASKAVLPKYWQLALSGAIFSVIFLNTSVYFEGFGGALGTTACISVVLLVGLNMIFKKLKTRKSETTET